MSSLAEHKDKIETVASWLENSHSILFITGAGISADSGMPTYRGVGGLYDEAAVEEGVSIEMALSGRMFHTDPRLTWKYIAEVERACRGATFNRGHEVIAEIERHFERVWTLTQNVDGLHRAAGARNVIEIHGDVRELLCPACGWRERTEDFGALELPPRCPLCGAVVRPDVVLFGEMLPLEKVLRLDEELHSGFDLVFTIGTQSAFPYIAKPVEQAHRHHVSTVEINPGRTEVSHLVDLRLPTRAAETLSAIWAAYLARR
jgi:NAD-dependent deacetylase